MEEKGKVDNNAKNHTTLFFFNKFILKGNIVTAG